MGFLSLGTTGIQYFIIGGTVLCIVGCLAASLASTREMPVLTSSFSGGTNTSVTRHCQMSPGGTVSPPGEPLLSVDFPRLHLIPLLTCHWWEFSHRGSSATRSWEMQSLFQAVTCQLKLRSSNRRKERQEIWEVIQVWGLRQTLAILFQIPAPTSWLRMEQP